MDTGTESNLSQSHISTSSKHQKMPQQDATPSIDHAILVWLAISDYSLSLDADLRFMVNFGAANGGRHLDKTDDAEGTLQMVADETDGTSADKGCTFFLL